MAVHIDMTKSDAEQMLVKIAALRMEAERGPVKRMEFIPVGGYYPAHTRCDVCGAMITDYWVVRVMQACNHCYRKATDDLYDLATE